MFTIGAAAAIGILAWLAAMRADKDRQTYDKTPSPGEDDHLRMMLLHIRQDVQLGIYLLSAVILFLGVIADLLNRR